MKFPFKSLFTFCFLLGFSFISNAQTTFNGRILDDKKEPISRVVVALIYEGESAAFATEFTDAQGHFSFNQVFKKDFTLKTQLLGYNKYETKINHTKIPNNLVINLSMNQKLLKEVEIEGTRVRVTQREDTVVYDAKAFKTHADANVEDLVRKMPGITRENGVIKAHGEEVKKVLVDGQEFFGDDANIALKNLPAETIDKVEVFDAMSDRSSFTGFNDGNTTKTINLKTKANMNKGYFGKAYAGYGTDSRYQLGGNYNMYNGSQRLSILGMSNNINNLNFSTSEIVGAATGSSSMGGSGGASMMRGMSFGMSVAGMGRNSRFGGPLSSFTVSNQDGVNKANSFGVNYNDLLGKNTKISANYFFNRTDNYTNTSQLYNNLINNANTLNSVSNDSANSILFSNRFNVRLEGLLDAKNSYVLTNKLEIQENNSDNLTRTQNYFKESGTSAYSNIFSNISKSQKVSFTSNFLYKLKFNRVGRTFSFNSIFDITDQDGTSNQTTQIVRTSANQNYLLNNYNKQWTNTITGILSYTEPSGKYGQWLLTYNPSISYKTNKREVGVAGDVSSPYVLSDSLSSTYRNPIFYNVGGLSYRLQYTKWRFMFGSNVQNINFKGEQTYPTSNYFSKDFFGVLPYFNIQFNPEKMFRIKLQYNTTLSVPSLTNIQPVLDISNPNSLFKGNSNLNAEYNHNLFFHFMKPNISKGTFLIFVSNFSLTQDKNSNFSYTAINDTTIDQVLIKKGVQYNKMVNLDGFMSGTLFANYSFPFKPIKSNLSFNSSFTYTKTPSVVNFEENMTKSFISSFGAMLSSNISENVDFSIAYNPKYITNSFSIKGLNNNNYWTHNISSDVKLNLFKNFVFSTNFNYNYNSQIDPSLNQHIFLLGSSIAYKMLKNRQLEAKLTVFDLLDQNKNISRSVTNTSISDSRINALNRYGMFTLTYNFKKFAGKDPDKNDREFFKLMRPAHD